VESATEAVCLVTRAFKFGVLVISRIVARRVFQPLNEPLNACFSSVDSRPILTGGYGVPPYKHLKMRALLRVWKHAPIQKRMLRDVTTAPWDAYVLLMTFCLCSEEGRAVLESCIGN
jgi:hypothetical protein